MFNYFHNEFINDSLENLNFKLPCIFLNMLLKYFQWWVSAKLLRNFQFQFGLMGPTV